MTHINPGTSIAELNFLRSPQDCSSNTIILVDTYNFPPLSTGKKASMDSLPQPEIDYQTAHFGDDLSTTLIVISNLFTAVAVLLLLARLVSRNMVGAPLGWDDYLACATAVRFL